MYQINDKFRAAMKSPVIVPRLRGTINNQPFSDEDILQGSFRACNQCVDVSQIALGGVFVGEVSLTLLPTIATERGGWVGKEIYIEYGLDCGDEIVYIPCPSGYYYIYSATWTANGLEVVAYDSMSKLDTFYSHEQATGKAYDWLTFISAKTGIKLGNTRAEIEAMPNGLEQLALYSTDDISTYRDLLMFLSSALGGFATCGRDGSIVIKSFTGSPVDQIDETKRFAGASFSDYVTKYTGLSIVNIETRETSYYSMPTDDGLTMKLGANPFLQFGTEATKRQMRVAILNNLQSFKYVPYTVTLLGCCAYDLGDVIRFTGGIAGGVVSGCVMSYDFSFNDYSFAGYGDNPALLSAQSKLEKDINGIYSSQVAEYASITPLINVTKLEVNTEWNKIGQLTFAVAKDQVALFHCVVKLNINESGLSRFKYRLNSEDIDFIHESYVTADTDTVTLFIPITIMANVFYTFEIFAQSDGFTGSIELYDVRGALFGIGVLTSQWDGTLTFEDVFKLSGDRDYTIAFNDDSINVALDVPTPVALSDKFVLSGDRDYTIAFSDNVSIITQSNTYELITEDGRNLTTEAGDPYITDGGENNG